MPTLRSLSRQYRVLETSHGPDERHHETCPSLLLFCSPFSTFSLSPSKQAADDPLHAAHPFTKTRTFRYTADSSVPPLSNPFTRSSVDNTLSHDAAPSPSRTSAAKKRVRTDDCDENTAPSAVVTSRKKRLARPPRKVKRLPLGEELEVLRDALPPVIRAHLDPPRDDKGPIPNERRTFGEFLRWKSMYNDVMVGRIVDERHVVCGGCRKSFWLCHDTAYNWYKWGRHRKLCIHGVSPPPEDPVLLHDELLRRTGRPEVDALFPSKKGGPYYKHSWTYFVPRPGQSCPDDPPDALSPRASSILRPGSRPVTGPSSARRQVFVMSEASPSEPLVSPDSRRFLSQSPRPCPWSLDPDFKAEEEPQHSEDSAPHGIELLLAASKFLERTNVRCTTCVFPRSEDRLSRVELRDLEGSTV